LFRREDQRKEAESRKQYEFFLSQYEKERAAIRERYFPKDQPWDRKDPIPDGFHMEMLVLEQNYRAILARRDAEKG
jgi:hypothetical protein